MAVNTRAVLLLESGGGTSATETLVATRPFRVCDVHGVVSVQGDAGNVTTLQRDAGAGYNPISSALSTAGAANSLVRTTTIVGTQDDVAVGNSVQWTTSGGDGTGRLIGYCKIIPRPITGQ